MTNMREQQTLTGGVNFQLSTFIYI